MKTKAELKAIRDERSAKQTLARLRGEQKPSKNHHGFIVTSPSGSVSLRDLPVPIHESVEKASKWAKAQGKPFVIMETAKFYRTSFGRTVQALTQRRALTQPRLIIGKEAIEETRKARGETPLTALLKKLQAKKQEKAFEEKVKADTPRPKTPAEIIARQLRTIGQTLDESRMKLADTSHLLQVMQPPKDEKIHRASNSDLASLFLRQTPEAQRLIDVASRFRWHKRRINKLVKSGSIESILTLFRAGKMPDKCRTYKNILKAINL